MSKHVNKSSSLQNIYKQIAKNCQHLWFTSHCDWQNRWPRSDRWPIDWPIATSPRPGGCEAHQSWSADARWGTPHKRHLTKNTGIVMGVSWEIHRDIMGKPSIESNDLINLIWMNGKSWPKLSFSVTGMMVNV